MSQVLKIWLYIDEQTTQTGVGIDLHDVGADEASRTEFLAQNSQVHAIVREISITENDMPDHQLAAFFNMILAQGKALDSLFGLDAYFIFASVLQKVFDTPDLAKPILP